MIMMEVYLPYHHDLSAPRPCITEVNRKHFQPHDHVQVVSPVNATRDTIANSIMSTTESIGVGINET
jgi:hypothetical protein